MDILQRIEQRIYKSHSRVIQEKMSIFFLILFSEAFILLYIGILEINTRILTSGLSLFILTGILFLRYANLPHRKAR